MLRAYAVNPMNAKGTERTPLVYPTPYCRTNWNNSKLAPLTLDYQYPIVI